MLAQMMNDGMMGGGMMAACMIGGVLLVAIVLVILVVQTVLLKRILTELRQLNKSRDRSTGMCCLLLNTKGMG